MNDDREPHLRLLAPPSNGGSIGAMNGAQILGFHQLNLNKERLFAGWVGCDGNVVPLKMPQARLDALRADRPRDDEWI
ncbi:MAG: hypothetical protein IT381_01220 [Deltaproteobacteria bacterium]|nr:hypothetical protein [Deltaproteobacteria bacterium]